MIANQIFARATHLRAAAKMVTCSFVKTTKSKTGTAKVSAAGTARKATTIAVSLAKAPRDFRWSARVPVSHPAETTSVEMMAVAVLVEPAKKAVTASKERASFHVNLSVTVALAPTVMTVAAVPVAVTKAIAVNRDYACQRTTAVAI